MSQKNKVSYLEAISQIKYGVKNVSNFASIEPVIVVSVEFVLKDMIITAFGWVTVWVVTTTVNFTSFFSFRP
jgi:hypothetical protein